MRLALALLLALALVGCLGEKSSPVTLQPYLAVTETAPGDALDLVLRVTSTSPFRQDLSASVEAPTGWTATLESANVTIRGRADLPLLVKVDPGANATYGAHLLFVTVGDSTFDVPVIVRDLREPRVTESSMVHLRVSRISAEGAVNETDDPLLRANATPGSALALADAPEDARALAEQAPALREGEARAKREAAGGVLLVRVARIE